MQVPQQQPQQQPDQQPQQQSAGRSQEGGQAENAAQGVAEQIGWLEEEGAFVLPLGAGVRLGADVLGEERTADIPLTEIPHIAGLTVAEARFNRTSDSRMIELTGTTAIPLVRASDFTLRFSRQGTPSGFNVRTNLTLDWLDNPELRLDWTPDGGLTTEVTVEAAKFVPEAVRRRATAEGDLTLGIANGQLSGNIDTTITVPNVLEGHFEGAFGADGLSATVNLTNKAEFLGELTGQGSIDAEGQMSATLTKSAGEMATPIPGLQFNGGTLSVSLNNDGTISGGITELAMQYGSFADTVVTFNIEGGAYSGSADLNLNIPGLDVASGTIEMAEGQLSGSLTVGRDSFPEGLPLQNGTITGRIGPTGALSFEGSVGISLGPGGTGQLSASYAEEGGFSIGATFDLSVPGMQTASFTIGYDGTDITGEGELAVDPEYLHGIEGRVRITYAEGRWAGETTLGYSADNGKLSGEITVRVRQAEDDSLVVGGDGEVTAQIAPRLSGTLRATILEEGGIDVSGEIRVTEPLEMFPERRFERELLNVSQNIPLWAILVAVLRIRAGVRAGIGPGVFRDITVSGSYTIGQEGEPSFSITGEMFIPAFVEGYVGFGAGLGASVVLGSLTGGIEAMGTAGIYGAISVVPELAYENGDYSIEGVATMAAGARLKLSLNAWAEIEALWVTVWENTWELASVTMPVGPDLGLEARMNYTFGSPEPPTLEFNSSDVDTDSLIQDAMPEDGPPSAGVRDEVRNEARWQGAQRAAGRDADAVPPELQDQANQQDSVPEPQAGTAPDGPGAPPQGQAGAAQQHDNAETGQPTAPAEAQAAADANATPDPAAEGTVSDAEAADTTTPRHGRLSMATLDEPPVPMPRTKEQQTADVQAAGEMVRIVSGQVADTDSLDDYFTRIKARFALGSIGYVYREDGSVVVEASVNASTVVTIDEQLRGQAPAEIRGRFNPVYTPGSVSYTDGDGNTQTETVATGMRIDVLTPGHPRGSEPRDTALQALFTGLETSGESGSHSYIKGHLLNHNLGGPGTAANLFPITTQANADHKSRVENLAKEKVNTELYWVRYEVNVAQVGATETYVDPRGGSTRIYNIVNSDMDAKLDLLDTTGAVAGTLAHEVIRSRFNVDRSGLGNLGSSTTRLERLVTAFTKQSNGEALDAKEQEVMQDALAGRIETTLAEAREILRRRGVAIATHAPNIERQAGTDEQGDPTRVQTVEEIRAGLGPDRAVAQQTETHGVPVETFEGGASEPLVLGDALLGALRSLVAAQQAGDYLGRSNPGLAKRLEAVPGLGSATAGTLLNNAQKAINENASATGPDRDIAARMGAATSVLRAVNNADGAEGIQDVLVQLNAERAAWETFTSRRSRMRLGNTTTLEILRALIWGFAAASRTDRTAAAQAFADYVRGRATLTLVGLKADLATAEQSGTSQMARSLSGALS